MCAVRKKTFARAPDYKTKNVPFNRKSADNKKQPTRRAMKWYVGLYGACDDWFLFLRTVYVIILEVLVGPYTK